MLNFSESNEYKRKQVGAVTASAMSILLTGKAPSAAVFADLTAIGLIDTGGAAAHAYATRILTSDAYDDLIG